MNEADPSPINLDELRMLPDWLREDAPAPSKQYAAHDYPLGDAPDRRGGRPGSFGGRNDRGGGGGAPDRRQGGGRSGPPPRRGDERGPRSGERRPPQDAPRPEPSLPAPIRVEFLPDDRCLVSINKQIRATHLAYPLFGLARMFLQEPERHFVQFSVAPDAPAGTQLYQWGEEGPVTLDRTTLEKMAFDGTREQFYVEETVQKEPLKGNFTNVARERLSGTLLGPTNYHAYQPALRSLYESRYSRRMSFEDFRRNVEVSTDPALIERWKEEARTTTTTSTRVPEGETPTVLNSPADVRAHFRQHHLDRLVRSGPRLKVHGSVARQLPEPGVMQAIRYEHEQEMRYPANFVQLLRQGLQNAGLHIFKHRKRVVYVSLARPTPFVAHGTVSSNVSAILETIVHSPLCTRKALAERVLARGLNEAATPPPGVELPPPGTSSLGATTKAIAPASAESIATELVEAGDAPSTIKEEAVTTPESPTFADALPASSDAVPGDLPLSASAPAPAEATAEAPLTSPKSTSEPASEDPFLKAKAALAADLRFLVQSGHIIEFHNGTFDLPLPPRAKEEGGQNQASGSKVSASKRPAPGRDARQERSPENPGQSSSATQVNEGKSFVAVGAGVAEAVMTTLDAIVEEAPSLNEVIERAPTAASLSEESTPDMPPTLLEEITPVVSGAFAEAAAVEAMHDKTDGDGLISGPGAAPMDLPLAGDSEDSPDFRP